MTKTKKYIVYLWIFLLLGIFCLRFLKPELFAVESFKYFFIQHLAIAIFIYFALGVIRGLTLLPLTPLLLTGMLFFNPLLLFLVTLVGVFLSCTIVYYWSKFLGFDQYFDQKYPTQLKKLKDKLRKNEFTYIMILGFFPFAPTEIICYACEILKINYWKCLSGIMIGTTTIYAIYIFGGSNFFKII